MLILTKLWAETTQKLIVALAKNQKKEAKKMNKIQMIPPDIREAVLLRYFAKCKRKHAAAFFEWRIKRRRMKVKHCVELLCNLRKRDHFIDEATRVKLLSFGVDGMAQIEEKRIKYENKKPIEKMSEIDYRGIINTDYNRDGHRGSTASMSQKVQSAGGKSTDGHGKKDLHSGKKHAGKPKKEHSAA